jgi:hypothetical protein
MSRLPLARFYCADGGTALPSRTNVISFGEKGVG